MFDFTSIDIALGELTEQMLDRVQLTTEVLAVETVNWMRSTDPRKTQPPARAGEGERVAHPGGWADITGNLQSQYKYRLTRYPRYIELMWMNVAEYAKYLDGKTRAGGLPIAGGGDAYWILSGILTEKDSPLLSGRFQQLLTESLQRL